MRRIDTTRVGGASGLALWKWQLSDGANQSALTDASLTNILFKYRPGHRVKVFDRDRGARSLTVGIPMGVSDSERQSLVREAESLI